MFDDVASLWSPSITLEQFVAFFCIFYNETGGALKPVAERGGPRYCFETKLPGGGRRPVMAAASAKVDQSPPLWAPTGTCLSGSSAYGSGVYTRRCQTLYSAMIAAGYEAG